MNRPLTLGHKPSVQNQPLGTTQVEAPSKVDKASSATPPTTTRARPTTSDEYGTSSGAPEISTQAAPSGSLKGPMAARMTALEGADTAAAREKLTGLATDAA